MQPYADQFSATAYGMQVFNGATDVIGGKSPIPGMNVRDALQITFPDTLIEKMMAPACIIIEKDITPLVCNDS